MKLRKNLLFEYGNTIVLLIFFVSVFAYMPTARFSDRIVWVMATLLLLGITFLNTFQRKGRIVLDKSLKWYLTLVLWGGYPAFGQLMDLNFRSILYIHLPL